MCIVDANNWMLLVCIKQLESMYCLTYQKPEVYQSENH